MAADLTFKIDGDASGLNGEVNTALAKLQKFGETGGLVGRAATTAMNGVTGAIKSAGTAMNAFVDTGKGAVAVLNHINGAVELANKVIPALTFPLAMAENAGQTKEAFDGMAKSWAELAGALGEGVNDALTPIMVSAGQEMAKLKGKAREIGQGMGEAIDFSRASIQLGNMGEILWLGLQKVLIQFGTGLLGYFADAGAVMGNLMEQAVVRAELGIKKLTGIGSQSEPQAKLRRLQAEANGPRPVLPLEAAAVAKVDDLNRQIEALSAPAKDLISAEKEAAKAAEAKAKEDREAGEAAKALADQFKPFFGGETKRGGGGGGGGGGGPGVTVAPLPKGWNYGKKISDFHSKEPINLPGAPSMNEVMGPDPARGRKGYGTHHIKGAGFRGPKVDPSALAHGVTNKAGASAAAKQERAAQQKDAKTASALDAVVKGIPQIALDMTAVKNHLSKLQSR